MSLSRRRYLAGSLGFVVSSVGVSSPPVDARRGVATGDELDEPDELDETDGPESSTIRFEGTGATVTDDFELAGGITIVGVTHRGDSAVVDLVSLDGGWTERLIDATGDVDWAVGVFATRGAYRLEIEADGDWTIEILFHTATRNEPETASDLEEATAARGGPF